MKNSLIGLWLFSFTCINAQKTFKNQHILQTLYPDQLRRDKRIESYELLDPDLHLYLIKLLPSVAKSNTLLQIKSAYKSDLLLPNIILHPRTNSEVIPDDILYKHQWALQAIHAPETWALTTGGKNSLGEDIVVAVVDFPVNFLHPDLTVAKELGSSEENSSLDHGTRVAGIIGAEGNNHQGITGINWQIKILSINYQDQGENLEANLASAIKAFSTIKILKKKYLETHGAEGENIVVNNNSWGNDADCKKETNKIWNLLYDEMGKLGILTVAATANSAVDVDQVGDIPTGCESDYIISVTNLTREKTLNSQAAYGLKSIDLGAPGSKILSTSEIKPNQFGYESSSGTSLAAPQVSGAIALAHSILSREWVEAFKNDPGNSALCLKKILLATTTPLESIKDKTMTGGMLNLFNFVLSASQAPLKRQSEDSPAYSE